MMSDTKNYKRMLKETMVKQVKSYCFNTGFNQRELSEQLGFEHPNYLSMILSTKNASVISVNDIDRYCDLLKLNMEDRFRLKCLRLMCGGTEAFTKQSLKALFGSVIEFKAAKALSSGVI